MKKEFVRNERLQGIFDLVANEFESVGPNYFTYFGQELVMRSDLHEGSKVLDVACGRGASLLKASEVIGPDGLSIGIDFSKEMIKNIEDYMDVHLVKNMKVMQMDAENLMFDAGSFDHVHCGLSLHFFTNPMQSIHEIFRVLKLGGKVCISTWGIKRQKDKKSVYQRTYERVFPDHIDHKNGKQSNSIDYSSPSGLENILVEAGFTQVDVQVESKTFYNASKEEWWQEQSNNATRGLFERIKRESPSKLSRFKEIVLEEIEKDMVNGKVPFEATVLYGIGIKEKGSVRF